MKDKIKKMSRMDKFSYVLLFLYFLSISAFRLGVGFDAAFVRVIFVVIMFFSIFRTKKIVIAGIFVWGLVLWGFYFLSSVWAKDASDTFLNVALAIQILGLFFFIPTYVKDKESMRIVLKLLLYSLVCTAIILLIKTPFSDFGTERLGEAIGLNSNAFGLRMAIGAIISLYLYHTDNKKKKTSKAVYLIIVFLLSVIALLSGSRKALITIILGIIGCELLLANGFKVIMKIFGAIAFIVVVFAVIFSNKQLYSIIGYRIEKTFFTVTSQDGDVQGKDRSLIERMYYIDQAVELFKEYPILGYGGDNFRTRMRELSYRHVAYSHNNYVEILCTLGIVGFTIYYSFWLMTLYRLIKIYAYERKENSKNPMTVLFLIILLVLLILDYGMVSYNSEFNMLAFCLIYLYSWSRRKEILGIQQGGIDAIEQK